MTWSEHDAPIRHRPPAPDIEQLRRDVESLHGDFLRLLHAVEVDGAQRGIDAHTRDFFNGCTAAYRVAVHRVAGLLGWSEAA